MKESKNREPDAELPVNPYQFINDVIAYHRSVINHHRQEFKNYFDINDLEITNEFETLEHFTGRLELIELEDFQETIVDNIKKLLAEQELWTEDGQLKSQMELTAAPVEDHPVVDAV